MHYRVYGIVKCEKLSIYTEIIFLRPKGRPSKIGGMFGRTRRTCLRPALANS